jgi:hypothetical protein
MRRFRTLTESKTFGGSVGRDPSGKRVLLLEFGSREYVWEFGNGDSYDWDGYEERVDGKWVTSEN